MQSFEEYRKEFLEDARATVEAEGSNTVASFVKLCALKLFEGDVLPEYTPCFYKGSGHRNTNLRVDGYSIDEHDGTFYLLVASFDGSEETITLLGSEARQELDKCRAFVLNSLRYDLATKVEISTQANDLASFIEEQASLTSKYVIILLTDKTLSERANLGEISKKKSSKKRTNVLEAEAINGIEVEYRIWDMPRFYRIFASGEGHEEIEIDFKQYIEGGIPCLLANQSTKNSECTSYLCTVPGNVIADLYDEYGSRMLEGNVRSFLGKKGVNKDIRNTVLNEPDKFFVYNNGLAATTVEVVVENGRLVYARDLQIVNGGQTTATLASTRRNASGDLSKISVLMKLTQVAPEVATTMVPIISRSANSQNKINHADFFSTHEYHIRLEQISRRKFAPQKDGAQHETHWFYERARGQYIQATMNMTKAEERKFVTQNPKDQVVTKTDLAKVLSAWDGYPHIVSKGAESNFYEFAKRTEAQWEEKKDDFNDKYFQDAVSIVILYRTTDRLIPKQDWYENGYKANIVAYTIALFHYLIRKWYANEELDLQKIWLKQKVPDVVLHQITLLTELVYYKITSDDRRVENVTQWCKQSACWDAVKLIPVSPVPGLHSVLIGYEEKAVAQKEARTQRKVENTIDDQKHVLELGEDYWKKLESWLRNIPIASDIEQKALKYATRMSKGYFPDERQSKNLIKLREKAMGEGFAPK